MNIIDIAAAVAIGFGLIRGLSNGVIKEVAGLVGVIIGIWAGLRLAFVFAEYYRAHIDVQEKLIPFLSFFTAFVIALVAVLLAGRMLSKMLDAASLTPVNKIAGGIFGAAKWAFIVGTVFTITGNAGVLPKPMQEGSATYPYLKTYTATVTEYSVGLIPAVKNVFTELDTFFHVKDTMNILPADTAAGSASVH